MKKNAQKLGKHEGLSAQIIHGIDAAGCASSAFQTSLIPNNDSSKAVKPSSSLACTAYEDNLQKFQNSFL